MRRFLVIPARGRVPSTDENSGGRALHRVSPPSMSQATEDELDSSAASAAKAGAVPGTTPTL